MPPKKRASKEVDNNKNINRTINSTKSLQQFLADFVYDKNVHTNGITNTRIGNKSNTNSKQKIYGGSWSIPENKYDEFLQIYYNEIVSCKKKEYFTEKQLKDEGAITIDLDFRHSYDIDERQYTINHIISFLDTYCSKIEKLFELVEDDIDIFIYVFEKPKVNQIKEKNITKDGIHIIIGLKCNKYLQEILRAQMIEEMPFIFQDIHMHHEWSYNDVFDEGVTKGSVGWQLYGSRKPDHDKYDLTHVYKLTVDVNDQEFIRREIPLEEFDIESNMTKLSVRYRNHPSLMMNNYAISLYKQFQQKNEKVKETAVVSNAFVHSPTINFNIQNHLQNIKSKDDIRNLFEEYTLQVSKNKDDHVIYDIVRYIDILPKEFYGIGSYEKWIRVCWALKYTSLEYGDPYKLLIVWLYFSSKAESFDISSGLDECIVKWNESVCDLKDSQNKRLTKLSIYHWAKQYAFNDYLQIKNSSIDHRIEETINAVDGAGDWNLANVLYELCKYEHICTSTTKHNWWLYKSPCWVKDESGTCIRSKITHELKKLYFEKHMSLIPKKKNDNDDEEEESSEDKLKKNNKSQRCCQILMKIVDSGKKSKIHKELSELFADKNNNFLQTIDSDPYLLACENGVIDFRERVFRPGRPDDLLTKTTNITYTPIDRVRDKEIIDEINEFMSQLFPIKELCDYAWEHLASTLIGITPNQTFNMYIGHGQNGKSVLIKFMEKVLGNYKYDISTTLITDKKMKMGQASPEYAKLPGIRYLVMTESSEDEEINEGLMKWITGGDKLQARQLYSADIMEFVPQFKLALACNKLPHIKATDHGTWRRIRAVPFLSLFTENPRKDDPKKPYQYKIDPTISEKFDRWAPVMFALLAEICFKTQGYVKDCDIVMEKCKEYRNDSDIIATYISEQIIIQEDGRIKKSDLKNDFDIWYEENNDSSDKRKKPTPKKIAKKLIEEYGEPKGNIWHGISIRKHNNDSEISNNDITKIGLDDL